MRLEPRLKDAHRCCTDLGRCLALTELGLLGRRKNRSKTSLSGTPRRFCLHTVGHPPSLQMSLAGHSTDLMIRSLVSSVRASHHS